MRTALCLLLASLLLIASVPGNAFCPKNGLLCLVTSKSAGSLTHQDITQRGIEELDKRYFAVPRLTAPMQKALDQIIEANAKVDEDQTSSAKHFDGENAAGAQLRLATLKQNVLDALRSDPVNAVGARDNLGSALHTIQDFYWGIPALTRTWAGPTHWHLPVRPALPARASPTQAWARRAIWRWAALRCAPLAAAERSP